MEQHEDFISDVLRTNRTSAVSTDQRTKTAVRLSNISFLIKKRPLHEMCPDMEIFLSTELLFCVQVCC
jgi:hypothetical protein